MPVRFPKIGVVMFYIQRNTAFKLIAVAVSLVCLEYNISARSPNFEPAQSSTTAGSLKARLARRADYIPQSGTLLERLVEVAKHYQLPMGIEWLDESGIKTETIKLPVSPDELTVEGLLNVILRQAPQYQMTFENEVINIAPPALTVHPNNLLNLRLKSYAVRNVNVFDAEEELWLNVDAVLHPGKYSNGYVGGYGYDPDNVLAVRNINFSGENLNVRRILDGIVKASGNALWLVRFNPTELHGNQPAPTDGKRGKAKSKFWTFIPLTEKQPSRPAGQPE